MTYFAVLDTNVLVSALLASRKLKDTPPLKVLRYMLNGTIIPVYDDEIMAEYSEVLRRGKFAFPEEYINTLLEELAARGLKVERISAAAETFPDEDDRVFYEIAISVDGSYLVTGNTRHFPARPFVVTPAEMVEIIESSQWPDRNCPE